MDMQQTAQIQFVALVSPGDLGWNALDVVLGEGRLGEDLGHSDDIGKHRLLIGNQHGGYAPREGAQPPVA